jgi:hypothetical protein
MIINIRSDFNVNFTLDEVDELSSIELSNIAYKELGVYISHTPTACHVKLIKNKSVSEHLINDYLNKGIYPFYKIMSSKLHAHHKMEIVKEIYHYLQIKDFMFFQSVSDALDVYKFNSQRNISKINIAQEMISLKAIGLDLLDYNLQEYNEVIPKVGIVDQNGFKDLIGFINKF